MKAVRFDHYGGIDVLKVVEVADPAPADGEVLVQVKAASINPGEAKVREGAWQSRWPATFPSGQGSDLAGVVVDVGSGVAGVMPGDELIGFTNNRASQAELVVVERDHVTPRPSAVNWDVAGSLFVAGATAWAAVRAVGPSPGEVVVVAGGAGGVGTIAVQLARNAGATVIALASENHHGWLKDHGSVPVTYGDGVANRVRKATGGKIDAMVDTVGGGYVDLAIELGVDSSRIDTIADFQGAARVGAKTDGSAAGGRAEVLAELAQLVVDGTLEIPIAATYPLEKVRDAYRELEAGHTLGKIVLHP